MERKENKELQGAQQNDLFTRMMFGHGSSRQVPKQDEQEQEQNTTSTDFQHLQSLLNNINIEELVKNFDTIKNSASHFKPLVTKLGPLINKWIK